jgi:transcriptional regulator with XRE-family HTH domain
VTNRIKELRERAGLSQGELAKLLDVDEGSVSRWEAGRRPLSPVVIERLARIFKTDSWQLFFDRKALRRLTDQAGEPRESKASENETRTTAKAVTSDRNAEKGHDTI